MKAIPIAPGAVAEYWKLTSPPTSTPKSNTSCEPFPDSWALPWYEERTSPLLADSMDFGETIRLEGAYMLASHGPGNAVSVGPEHVVFLWCVLVPSWGTQVK